MSKENFIDQVKSEIEKPDDEVSKKLEACKIDVLENIPQPEKAWELKESKISEYSLLGTLGNFSLVKGKAKSKKSFFINMALACAVGKGMLQNKFRSHLKSDFNEVLYFDTEQSKYHVQAALKRICKQLNEKIPTNLTTYGLRKENPAERLKMVEYAIKNTRGLGFVVIDGIRDLITSINDEAESTTMASKLLQWTEEYNIHILVVLHENPGSEKARGHIGTELTNKAETVIGIEIDNSNPTISVVKPSSCRNKAFEPFAFEITNEGLPQIVEDYIVKAKISGNDFDLTKLNNTEKFQLLIEVFSNGNSFTHGDLVSQIKEAINKRYPGHKGRGDNKIKEFITWSKDNKSLIQEGDRKPYKLGELSV